MLSIDEKKIGGKMLDDYEWEQVCAALDTMQGVNWNGVSCVPIENVKFLLQKWSDDYYLEDRKPGKVLYLVPKNDGEKSKLNGNELGEGIIDEV